MDCGIYSAVRFRSLIYRTLYSHCGFLIGVQKAVHGVFPVLNLVVVIAEDSICRLNDTFLQKDAYLSGDQRVEIFIVKLEKVVISNLVKVGSVVT